MKRRKYKQQARADQASETRRRIAKATMELHGELGPAETTISAVAKRAGVQRLTVYRHFPTDKELFAACSGLWMEENPVPDAAIWAGITDPTERTRAALTAIYGFYRRTAEMQRLLLRDESRVPAMAEPMRVGRQWAEGVRDDLLASWKLGRGSAAPLRALLGHALRFSTWDSLSAEGLNDSKAAELMVTCARSVAR